MEYVRNRRLTLAAEELALTDCKIIDIALKYGYESADAFTKAFRRLHGITPLELKKGNMKIKSFPKLTLQISINGETELNYRVVKREGLKVFGVDFETTTFNDTLYREIPEFSNRIYEDGTHDRINQILGYPKKNLLNGYYDFKDDGRVSYMIGWEIPKGDIPNTFKTLDIPECTWVVFESVAQTPHLLEIQNLWRRIYTEWFPSSGFEQIKGPCIEKHYWNDHKFNEYTCEVWIPIKTE